MRHALLQKMLYQDEARFGSSYDKNNKWVENTLRSKAAKSQRKAIKKDSKSATKIMKPLNGKNSLTTVPQRKL